MSGTTLKLTKAATLALVQALMRGLQKRFPNGSFTFGNTVFTTAQLLPALQSLVDAMAAVDAAQKSASDAMAALRAVQPKVTPVLQELVRFIRATFGTAAQPLADFGLEPPKARTTRTSEQKAAAAAKLRATRKARGTTSKKQKLAISGNVTGVDIIPVTTPASPAQPASGASGSAPTGSATKS
jgi:hypothetical protein